MAANTTRAAPKRATIAPSEPKILDPAKNEAIEFEFNYYCILIRDLQPFMPEEGKERKKIVQWIHFLVNPMNETQQLEFREKRNLYLFLICSSLLSDNVEEFLKIVRNKHLEKDQLFTSKFAKVKGMKLGVQEQKTIANAEGFPHTLKDALSPQKLIQSEDYCFIADWEKAKHWKRRLANAENAEKATVKASSKQRVQGKKDISKCSVHGPDAECPPPEKSHKKVGDCLDKQFNYLLSLAEFYANGLINDANGDKNKRLNLWLQAISMIDPTSCIYMKGIRNDYAMVLVGYLVNGELKGPFEDLPPETLQPLTQAIATYIEKRNLKNDAKVPLNPAGETIENFMCEVPNVEEGAFALLALSGNLFNRR